MALTNAGLSAAIKSALDGAFPIATGTNATNAASYRQQFADVVAQAVVTYLVANNVVVHPMGPGRMT
jgi:hypothetical protein